MKRIAVIGAGFWGKNLVRTFSTLGALETICDINGDLLKEYGAQYPEAKRATDAQAIFQDKRIEGVVIATPPASHYAIGKEALLNHKHIFVEKPLSLSVAEGEELVQLAENKGSVLMVGHILQYHRAVLKLKELIDEGELGKIQYIYSNRLNIGKIRTDENILWSFAPHDISVILMLLNEFPISIHTAGGSYVQSNVVDTTMTALEFPSGVKAHIFVSWLHPFKEHKLVVVGEKKMAVFDDLSKDKLLLYPHQVKWVGRTPVASKADAERVAVQDEEPLLAECRHFLDCIEKGRSPRTDGREGLRVLRVLGISQDSLNLGRTIRLNDLSRRGEQNYFIHESSYVDDGVTIGEGTQIWHFSHVRKGSRIGKECKIGQNVMIGPNVVIGDRCKIQNNVSVYEGVTLEDEVFCGPSMVFTNVLNPRSAVPRMKELRKTVVKKGATLGANATLVCGVSVGRYAFIGAGAVVTRDVPDYGLVYGNPAELKGWMCACGVKLEVGYSDTVGCHACGAAYVWNGECLKEASRKDAPVET